MPRQDEIVEYLGYVDHKAVEVLHVDGEREVIGLYSMFPATKEQAEWYLANFRPGPSGSGDRTTTNDAVPKMIDL